MLHRLAHASTLDGILGSINGILFSNRFTQPPFLFIAVLISFDNAIILH